MRDGRTGAEPKGFTIVELLIATAVFSLILVVALTGFFQVGQTFFKGQSNVQAQENAKSIVNTVAADIKVAASVTTPRTYNDANYICIGSARYTYKTKAMVDLNDYNINTKFGLLRDILPGNSGCDSPAGIPFDASNPPKELLNDHTRLAIFCICNYKTCGDTSGGAACIGSGTLYNVLVKVAYGDNESLQDEDTLDPKCDSNLSSSRFCGIGEILTTVSRGY